VPRQPLSLPRAGRLVGVGVILLGLLALAVTPPASAGSSLVAADPADGAVLPAAPTAVTLTFATPPDRGLSHVSVADSAGTAVGAAEVIRAGSSDLRLPVSIHAPGDYTVAFHAVLTDGSETTGTLRFSVGTGVPPAGAGPAATAAHQHTIDPFSAVLLVVDLVVLLTVVLLLLAPRRPGLSAGPT
jgi:methionine-rich copper-binding protein CopC